ncbi:hypothetical protein [[Clostridium] polysaccharolyticum]|uniref:Uncharacterized protein n=1 Tax=[Clostridium] polysaccharolyticum TaxID=29364 RepID=A0A1I0DWF9_9FIRM|nr:hypothetical protein [[Clostridium] polysaccharolyticum]SET36981.1 hypothetical protein SAMN04487772_11718 [[Clostridium] polysaccharolyticum]
MFEDALEKRIKELDEHLVSYSDKELSFREKQKDGKMEFVLKLSYPCILFRDVDENCLKYFKSKKTADCIMFEQKDSKTWALHIFEMKATVKSKEWGKIREQFRGAYYNALAIAGYLGIESYIKETKLYTCFQKDKITEDPSMVRGVLNDANSLIKEWIRGRVNLDCFDPLCLDMEKIKAVEDDNGQVVSSFIIE